MSQGAAPRQGILSLTIKDKSALYAAYMPFIKGGGLFIPTKKEYQLGDEVFSCWFRLPVPVASTRLIVSS